MPKPPPGRSADRNLLFGILAWQMDFITRDALLAAMNAWVLAKDTPLGQILWDQGALGPDDHTLLEAVVQRHLERHDNNPGRSLAALGDLSSIRSELAQVDDGDWQASLVCSTVSCTSAPRSTTPTAGESFTAI
jgi:hypothetical protein